MGIYVTVASLEQAVLQYLKQHQKPVYVTSTEDSAVGKHGRHRLSTAEETAENCPSFPASRATLGLTASCCVEQRVRLLGP